MAIKLDPYRTELNELKSRSEELFNTCMGSIDPNLIARTIDDMIKHQEFAMNEFTRFAAARYSFNPEIIEKELQVKLEEMIAHNNAVVAPTFSAQTAPKSSSVRTLISDPTDLAVGFGNKGANCWINSLLSMLPALPPLRTAFETVGTHYAKSQNSEDKKHGQYMLDALAQYDAALAGKRSVPADISQNVRLAFHHFFHFSESQHIHEDASEAMILLMGRYEEFAKASGQPMPALYTPLTTSRHYRPMGAPTPANPEKVRTDQYPKLTQDNVSASTHEDYEILLVLQDKGHLSFSELVAEYFSNTHPHGDGTYLLPNLQQLQKFELIGEGRRFARAPQELLLTIKRFGNENRSTFKIVAPLAVSKTLVLPAAATPELNPVAYELDAFIVHSGEMISGGHYSTYRKAQGRWIEINDANVRFVSEEEISDILEGRKGPEYTSYMHHYVRNPSAVLPAPVLSDIPALEQEIEALAQSVRLFEENTDLNNLPAHLLETFHLTVWMNDLTPEIPNYGSTALTAHPQKVRETRRPWLIGSESLLDHSTDSLWDQMLKRQTLKLQIATEKCHEAKLRAFLDQLKSAAPNDALLASLKRLPRTVQNALHGLVYQSHLIILGREKVDQDEYGKKALEQGDIRKTLLDATESVLNLWGNNILEQLIADTQLKIDKLQLRYEKRQLKGFYDLLVQSPIDVNNRALVKAFERLEIRDEFKDKLMWHIWYAHGKPSIADYGRSTFRANPRVLLSQSPLCPQGSNILWQMITLLDHGSK